MPIHVYVAFNDDKIFTKQVKNQRGNVKDNFHLGSQTQDVWPEYIPVHKPLHHKLQTKLISSFPLISVRWYSWDGVLYLPYHPIRTTLEVDWWHFSIRRRAMISALETLGVINVWPGCRETVRHSLNAGQKSNDLVSTKHGLVAQWFVHIPSQMEVSLSHSLFPFGHFQEHLTI